MMKISMMQVAVATVILRAIAHNPSSSITNTFACVVSSLTSYHHGMVLPIVTPMWWMVLGLKLGMKEVERTIVLLSTQNDPDEAKRENMINKALTKSDTFIEHIREEMKNEVYVKKKNRKDPEENEACSMFYESVFRNGDKDNNSLIDYNEFINIQISGDWTNNDDEIKLGFRIFDADINNVIDSGEWTSFVSELLPIQISNESGTAVKC